MSGRPRRLPGIHALAHALADDVVTGLLSRPRLYPDGFGDLAALDRLVELVKGYDRARPPATISVRWDGPAQTQRGVLLRSGRFRSPAADVLPPASQEAYVQLWLPPATREHDRPPVVILLAATGEEGFAMRRGLARRLAAAGIGALLLENPFYGKRRPPGQRLALLRTVQDQFAMNCATVDEAVALLCWLRARGHERVGASGYSQGGMMAAFAGALAPDRVAAIPRAAGRAAGPIFTENALSRRFAWDRLARPFGDVEAARRHFAACLVAVDVGRFAPPIDPRLCVLVAARHDRFVPPEQATALHEHWQGAELRWLDAGHLTGALRGDDHFRAIVDAFSRFDDRR
jgi:dienelactone hydrolase